MNQNQTQRVSYRGRFAPTPSGPLHMGSLMTALASFLQARAQGGHWLLRLDDLDGPRCISGADSIILKQLESHGLLWDGTIRYQSQQLEAYEAALQRLQALDLVYACSCTRARLSLSALQGSDGPIYDGHCRDRLLECRSPRSLRLRTEAGMLAFDDGWRGWQKRRMQEEVGDFILRRADGIFAYQLACAVDEAAQGITEVVRGSDLLGSTFQQIHIQNLLQLPNPRYRHLPVLVDGLGRKLSKQNHARPLDPSTAGKNLARCLKWLGQATPIEIEGDKPEKILEWALMHWEPLKVPQQTTLSVE